MKRKKMAYTKEFKETVLKFYQKAGPKAASEAFGVEKSLILSWRRQAGADKFCGPKAPKSFESVGPSVKRKQYTKQFKTEVLEFFKVNGEKATASKFQINSNLIYDWRKKEVQGTLRDSNRSLSERKEVKEEKTDPLLLEKVERFKKYSDEQKREVLTYYGDHGKEETISKYGITRHRLSNWIKKSKEDSADKSPKKGRMLSREEREFRMVVLNHAKSEGIKAASVKYNVTIPKIWDWRSRAKKRNLQGKKVIKKATRIARDHNHKQEIVDYYLENGALACEEKYEVPRQTVRNWALKNGHVDVDISSTKLSAKRKEALEHAMSDGVRSAVAKYCVSRASLYNWSKHADIDITEEDPGNGSIAIDIKKSGKVRRIVFFKKKPVKVKVPKEKKPKKEKPKKKADQVTPECPSKLPEWAKEFIKKKVPKVEKVEKYLVLCQDENGSFFLTDENQANHNFEEVKKYK